MLNFLFISALLLCFLVNVSFADVYGHNPRFSNNRLNENGQNRDNDNRLCDTQNNAKGGYCWGPKMHYYVGSLLTIEWTNQHSCSHPNAYCEIVLQYMCGEEVRDGLTTDTIPDDEDQYNTKAPDTLTGSGQLVFKYGMHENYTYYQDCKTRERNRGLFTADQNLNGNAARFTRQNPNGGRSGFECPEERDYYPYWHPTPWKDIAVLPNTGERCQFYKTESQNVKEKGYCSLAQFNNPTTCEAGGGAWRVQAPWGIPPPECLLSPWSRDNHLGNTPSGHPPMYNWTIPDDLNENCALRIRYNISTGDYDNWAINSTLNGRNSPIQDDPSVNVMGRNLTLALNTAQTGRTFQDRTHVFAIRPRPDDIPDSARIYNLNVRGKRGNIVQVYPAVEYDFVPQVLNVRPGDYIHFQWTGCDTNPANNDGEGTRQTDRSNIVQIENPDDNYPAVNPANPLFTDPQIRYKMAHINQNDSQCLSYEQLRRKNNNNENDIEEDVQNCAKLNAASPYFNGGLVKMENKGSYNYMSTRNNNFSNRSQKGVINVEPLLPNWAVALLVIGSLLVVGAGIGVAAYFYGKSHPDSKAGRLFGPSHKTPVA